MFSSKSSYSAKEYALRRGIRPAASLAMIDHGTWHPLGRGMLEFHVAGRGHDVGNFTSAGDLPEKFSTGSPKEVELVVYSICTQDSSQGTRTLSS